MRRVLVLNYEFPPLGGGASPVSLEVAQRLAETGEFDLDVVTMRFGMLPKFESLGPRLKVHRVRCIRSKQEMCEPHEQLTYLVTAYAKASALHRAHAYDVVHCHFIIPTGALALALKAQFGLPYVLTSHGSDVLGYGPRFERLYPFLRVPWGRIVHGASTVVCPSAYLREAIERAYSNPLPADHLRVIPNGVDVNVWATRPKRNIIFSSGRLLVNKGFQHLIAAVSEADLGWEVHIAGDGPMRAELERMAAASRTPIVFHGWMDNKSSAYRELVGSAGIFVLASERENASVVLLEAMASGCALVTSTGSGTAEMVGEDGVLVRFGAVESLAAALTDLVTDAPRRLALQTAARNRALARYGWPAVTQAYAALLR